MANKQWTTPLPFYNLLLLIIIAQSRLKQNLYKTYQQSTWPGFLESRLIYPPISVKSTIKFLIPRITNRGLKRSS